VKLRLTIFFPHRQNCQGFFDKFVGTHSNMSYQRAAKRSFLMVFLLLACVALANAQNPPAPTHDAFAIVRVTLIPMTGDVVLPDQTVIVEGGRISKIGSASNLPVPKRAKRIDGSGKYLIPGLIDSHVHLYTPQQLQLYLANGVTTVFNLNGRPIHLVWRDEVARGKRWGPRIYTVGPKFERADPPEKAVELVDQYWKQGYDGIKVYNEVSKAEYPSLMAEAKKHHMLIVGHIPPGPGFETTLQAGQAIAHAEEYLYTFFEEHNPGEPPDPRLIPEAVAMTKAAGVVVIATLVTYEHIVEQATNFEAFLQRPENQYWAPWEMMEIKDPSQNRYLDYSSDQVANLKRNYPFQKVLVKQLRDGGVTVLAGSDAGSVLTVPGFSLHEELENFVQCGFKPIEALRSATLDAARFLRGDQQFGTIEQGKAADLVLLAANPLDAIANARQIAGVAVRGQWFDKAALDNMRQQLPGSYRQDEERARSEFAANPQQATAFLKRIDPFSELAFAVVSDFALREGVNRLERRIQGASQSDPESDLNSPEMLNHVADYLLEKRRNDDAFELYRFNITQHPKSAIAYDRLARARYKLGQYDLALKFYRDALNVDPGYWNADFAKTRINELTKKLESKN
jgi:hypothetical protein